MSRWRVGIDCGKWFVSEIADWSSSGSWGTEAEAVGELRRIQLREVQIAEESIAIEKKKLAERRAALKDPPRISRMPTPNESDDPK